MILRYISNTPPQGGRWTVGTPPRREVLQKNSRSANLFNYINLHPPNILLHPPIFEILENTLITIIIQLLYCNTAMLLQFDCKVQVVCESVSDCQHYDICTSLVL